MSPPPTGTWGSGWLAPADAGSGTRVCRRLAAQARSGTWGRAGDAAQAGSGTWAAEGLLLRLGLALGVAEGELLTLGPTLGAADGRLLKLGPALGTELGTLLKLGLALGAADGWLLLTLGPALSVSDRVYETTAVVEQLPCVVLSRSKLDFIKIMSIVNFARNRSYSVSYSWFTAH